MERKLLISDLTIGYEGLFDAADFIRLVNDWFKQHDYEKNEIRHTERISEKGKFIHIEIMPYKELNDYTRHEIYVKIYMENVVDKNIKKGGKEFKINKGKISVIIDVFLATDIRYRLEAVPWQFFLRTMYNKWLNKEYIRKAEQSLMVDVKNFHSELKAYLNLNRYQEQA